MFVEFGGICFRENEEYGQVEEYLWGRKVEYVQSVQN